MPAELLPYNSAIAIAAGPAAENFRIDPQYTSRLPERFLTSSEITLERDRLLTKPPCKRTFLIGSFSSRIDPETGIILPEDKGFIETIHNWYAQNNVECVSSFQREQYGTFGITNTDATALDKLAISMSHVLTVLPGSSMSPGTWEEIRYGGSLGRSLLFLFRGKNNEKEFQQEIRHIIANLSTHPLIMFLYFNDLPDLEQQLAEVWNPIANIKTTDEQWEKVSNSAMEDIRARYSTSAVVTQE